MRVMQPVQLLLCRLPVDILDLPPGAHAHFIKIDSGMKTWDKHACGVDETDQPASQRKQKDEPEQPTWQHPRRRRDLHTQITEREERHIQSLQACCDRDNLFSPIFKTR